MYEAKCGYSMRCLLKLAIALLYFSSVHSKAVDPENIENYSISTYSLRGQPFSFEQRSRSRRGDGIIYFPSKTTPVFSARRTSVLFTSPSLPSSKDPIKSSPQQISTPRCNDNEDYCEDVDGYPFDIITMITTNVSSTLEIMEDPAPEVSIRSEFVQPICFSKQKSIYPKLAKNYHDEEMWIVNEIKVDKTMLKQRVDIEVCSNAGGKCGFVGEGSTTECSQKFIYKKLLSVNTKDLSKAVIDIFKFPSCCVCLVHTPGFPS